MNDRARTVSPASVIPDDVEKRFQAGLHAGVGRVGVNLKNQVRLGAHLGGEHRVGERVNGATEVAHAKQEQVRVLPDQGHGIEDLVGEVPRGRPFPTGARQSAGMTVMPMLEVSCPPIAKPPA